MTAKGRARSQFLATSPLRAAKEEGTPAPLHRLSEVFDAPEVYSSAATAIEPIGSFPAMREDFEREFKTMRAYAPREFVQVCMHALRWPELRSFFEQQPAWKFYRRYFVESADD